MDLREAGIGPATPLLTRLLTATDCPRDREGVPSTAGVLRVWRQNLAVAWADMLEALPDEVAAAEVTFATVRALAYAVAGRAPAPIARVAPAHAYVPRLTEPWFCCAEPTRAQLDQAVQDEPGTGSCCSG